MTVASWVMVAAIMALLMFAAGLCGHWLRKGIIAASRWLRDTPQTAAAMDGGGELRAFFATPAGKGGIAAFLTALLVVWPSALSWLVASVTLTYAVVMLGRAGRRGGEPVRPVTVEVDDEQADEGADDDVVASFNRRFPGTP